MTSVTANLWDVATTQDRFRLSREDVNNAAKIHVVVKKAAFRLQKQGAKVISGNKVTLVEDCTKDITCLITKIGNALEKESMPLSKQEVLAVMSTASFVNGFRMRGVKIPILLGRMTTLRAVCKRIGGES